MYKIIGRKTIDTVCKIVVRNTEIVVKCLYKTIARKIIVKIYKIVGWLVHKIYRIIIRNV